MTIRLISFAALAACTGVSTHPGQPDARPDAPHQIDAPIDTPVTLMPHHYIIDAQTLPSTNTQARALGLDLNNDGTVDNQLGMVMAVFVGQGIGTSQPSLDTDIDRGDILMLADLESDSFTTGPATFTLYAGANPVPPACNGGSDTTCRHHLNGNGMFEVSSSSPRDTPLPGTFTGGTMLTAQNGGRLHLQTVLMTLTPITLDLIGAEVKVTGVTTNGIMTGIICGGVTQADIDTALIPGWQATLQAKMNANCPGGPPTCGCTSGSEGETLRGLFDTNHDCTISTTEIRTNSLIQSLIAPDVTLGGQQALSLGIGFTAASATFTP